MFARNPQYLKHKSRSKYEDTYNLKHIQKHIKQAKNILDACGNNPTKTQEKMIKTCVENVLYVYNHPLFDSNALHNNIMKELQRCVILAKSVNIKTEPVKKLESIIDNG